MATATSFLALALARSGHSVELLTGFDAPASLEPPWDDVYARAGIGVRRAPESPEAVEPWPFVGPHSVALGLHAAPPEVVVAHDFGAPAYSALRLRQAGMAFEDSLFVVFCHGSRRYIVDRSEQVWLNDLRQVLAVGVLEQACVELADVVVSPSAYLVEWMRDLGGRLPARTLVIPYFTRSSALGEPPPTRPRPAGERLERLTFFGRVDEKKGLKVFAEALNGLEAELLAGVELEFLGKTTGTWTRERAESLLSQDTRGALGGISFETDLDQPEALAHLGRTGTLAVMPTLHENSPNTVYECLEHGIPFIASDVGGIPELIAPDDRRHTLFEPTADGVGRALRRVLESRQVPPPARAAFAPDEPARRWEDVVALRPTRAAVGETPRVDVVVGAASDTSAAAPFVLFLDEADVAEPELVRTLAHAQAVSGAAAVTGGIRIISDQGTTLHFFAGDPGGPGVLANQYGTPALVRRSALRAVRTPWAPERDADWPLLAALAAAGETIVSVPAPLVTRAEPPGRLEDDPADALLAVRELETALPAPLQGTVRLAAGLAADTAPAATSRPAAGAGLAVLALTLLAAALRFGTLGRQSYWYDELVTVSLLHRSFGGLLHAIPSSEATPYLYYVLAWPWARLFGFGEAGVRSLSALAGTLTVPVTYAAGAVLASRRVGLVAAALVAVNPFLIWYSQEARAYALFALLAAGTVYFFARAWRGGCRSLIGWAVTAAAAVATQYFAVFVVAAEAILLVRCRRRDALLAAAAPAAVLAAELPLILKQRHNGANVAGSALSHRLAGIPKDLLVGYSFPAELAGTALALLLVLAGVWLALARTTPAMRRRALVAAAIALFALAVPVLLALVGGDYVLARNMIAVVVPAAIFVGAGYATGRTGLVLVCVLCALCLAIAISVAADRQYGRTDWRGAAAKLGVARAQRAIVASPTIDATLLGPYLHGIEAPKGATVRVDEVDVIALASQGGFSSGAVKPPTTPPRPAPPGFHLAVERRTPTFVLVRYRAPKPITVAQARLAALGLATVPPAVLLQRPVPGDRR
jgi:glycosyltransferase involved in cell wall biosynthesis